MTTPPTRRMRLEMVDESTNCMGETIARTSPVRRCVRSPVRMPSKKAMS